MLRFAEELLLLEDQSGKVLRLPDRSLQYALAGSVLMDLTLEGRIDTDPDRLILVDSTPTGDDLVDPILADIVNGGDHNVHYWLTHAARSCLANPGQGSGSAGFSRHPGPARG